MLRCLEYWEATDKQKYVNNYYEKNDNFPLQRTSGTQFSKRSQQLTS